MRQLTSNLRLVLCALTFVIAGCGGGGDGGGGACSALRIAGGEACGDGSHSVVALFVERDQGLATCTGTYVSLTSVLTAAHCVRGARAVLVASRENVVEATSSKIHPSYNGSVTSAFDIAILKVSPSSRTVPIPILLSRSPEIGEELITYGYGLDESGSDVIERVRAGEIPLRAATVAYGGYDQGTETVTTVSGSTCAGDSGGPVLAKGSDGTLGIVGITRSGPSGCSAEPGRETDLASLGSRGALDFVGSEVLDAAYN